MPAAVPIGRRPICHVKGTKDFFVRSPEEAITNLLKRAHFLHRAWRYRLRSEKFGVTFLRSRELRGRTAVDIGANQGIFSYWMSRCVGPEGRVVAFEPQPELAAHLQELRRGFGLNRLEIVEAGLSSAAGELTLHRPKDFWGGAGFQESTVDDGTCDLIRVQVTKLDDHFAGHADRPIAFIKCNVEGHELQVFQGGQRILTQDRPDLLFECHEAADTNCPVFSYLRSLQYAGFCFFGDGFAPIADFPALCERMYKRARQDVVFVPRERAAELRLAGSTTARRVAA